MTATANASLSPKGGLRIIKKEKTETGQIKDLKDVTIRVTNTKDSNYSWEWNTSDTNPFTVNDIPTGQYRIEEIKAPEGIIKAETQIVTVKPLQIETVELMNYRTEKVPVSKQDATTSKELPGATLVLKDADGKIIDKWVSTTQPHYINDLPEGVYTLIETQSPEGYGISDEVITFEVKYDGKEMAPVVMYNSKIPETADINIKYVIFMQT